MAEFTKSLTRTSGLLGFSLFKHIELGNFKVSIQGSEYNYSIPRINTDPDKYTAMEVAIFEQDKWVKPVSDPRFSDKSWAELFENAADTSVAGYVPVEVIDQIIKDIKEVSQREPDGLSGRYVDF